MSQLIRITLKHSLMLSILAFFIQTNSFSQVRTGYEYKTNCLEVNLQAFGVDSSCESIAWFIGNSNTPAGRNEYLSYTFSSAGTYKVCMQVFNFCTKKDTSYCKEIKVEGCGTCDSVSTSIKIVKDTTKCGSYRFVAYPMPNNTNNFSYQWTFGEGSSSIKRESNFQYLQNGTYKACAKINFQVGSKNCERTHCETIEVKCHETKKCNWEGIGIGHSASRDICGKVIFEANALKDSCVSVEYYFDGKWYSGRIFDKRFTSNGSYKYGFRYVNQCTGCDTTLYAWAEVNCFTQNKCDMSSMNFEYVGYAANSGNCRKYVFEAKRYEDSCMVQKIKIVHENTVIFQETGRVHYYTFEKDGYYNVCFWAKNECLNCDTWVCKTVYVNCANAAVTQVNAPVLSIRPNPATSSIMVDFPEISSIQILDALGREIYIDKKGIKHEISIVDWNTGVYHVRVIDQSGKVYVSRFIKE